jgi:protein phosphatase PTC7
MLRLLKLDRALCSAAKQTHFKFQFGASLLPHPEKAYKGGEDALYASDHVLLVADGVGGWADSGIDPALYSKRLAALVEELVAKDKLRYIENPKELIRDAVGLNKETGSTTVCLLTLHPTTGLLRAYYLGDSVYAIINPSNSSYRSAPDQQYEFNFPVQVGTNGADPTHGIAHEFTPEEVGPEEYVVVGSDGIWDNLKDFMIYQVVAEKGRSLEDKAKTLTAAAGHYGKQADYESPFHLKAKEMGIDYPKQGKLDDNAAIVAQIIRETL